MVTISSRYRISTYSSIDSILGHLNLKLMAPNFDDTNSFRTVVYIFWLKNIYDIPKTVMCHQILVPYKTSKEYVFTKPEGRGGVLQ